MEKLVAVDNLTINNATIESSISMLKSMVLLLLRIPAIVTVLLTIFPLVLFLYPDRSRWVNFRDVFSIRFAKRFTPQIKPMRTM